MSADALRRIGAFLHEVDLLLAAGDDRDCLGVYLRIKGTPRRYAGTELLLDDLRTLRASAEQLAARTAAPEERVVTLGDAVADVLAALEGPPSKDADEDEDITAAVRELHEQLATCSVCHDARQRRRQSGTDLRARHARCNTAGDTDNICPACIAADDQYGAACLEEIRIIGAHPHTPAAP